MKDQILVFLIRWIIVFLCGLETKLDMFIDAFLRVSQDKLIDFVDSSVSKIQFEST